MEGAARSDSFFDIVDMRTLLVRSGHLIVAALLESIGASARGAESAKTAQSRHFSADFPTQRGNRTGNPWRERSK
jgi:hypothetical protein